VATAILLLWMMAAAVLTQVSSQPPQLVLEIRSEHDNLRAGDEILITFVVTNVGTTGYKYPNRTYDRSGRMGEYRLRAYDERGTPIPDLRTLPGCQGGPIGGGIFTYGELQPGQQLSKTIALNSWALITEPGVYDVRGIYVGENSQSWAARPLTLRVLPRSNEEMGRDIEELAAQLQDAGNSETRTQLIRRLMYTTDRRAVKPLLELSEQDNSAAFWIRQALSCYLPKDPAILAPRRRE
jgi:hypothetical protein